MNFAFPSRRLALLAALASSLWLAACGGGSGGGGGQTTVRAINLSSDLPSVDIYTDTTKQFSALATDALSNSITIGASTYTVNVKRAGDGSTLLTGSYSLSENKHYTAVVWGRETSLRLATLPEDENTGDIATGNSRLRVYNATTDTGSVDVFLTTTNADLGDTTPTQPALASGTLGGFRDVSAGNYRLRVTGVGDPNDVRLDIPVITLGAQKYATLVLTAGSGGVLVNGTLIEQQGAATTLKNTLARVRAVASVASAGNVAVTVGTSTVVAGLRSPNIGPYTLVPAGTLDMTVRVNGAVVNSGTRTFAAGGDYTVLTYGAAGAAQVGLVADDNRLPTSTSRVKIRLLNGIATGDPLTLSVDFLALLSNVPAGSASAYATANSNAAARIDVTSASAISSLYSETSVNLQGQGVYTVLLLDGNAAPQGVIRKER